MLLKPLRMILIGAGVLALTACASSGDAGVAKISTDQSASTAGAGDVGNYGNAGNSGNKALQVGNQSYYFDFNQSTVKDADIASIKVQSSYLATHANAKVRLEGNTDVRGSREYNVGLGERRAVAVMQQLVANGASKNQLSTISYGAQKALSLPQDEDTYAKERRVDLVYETSIKK